MLHVFFNRRLVCFLIFRFFSASLLPSNVIRIQQSKWHAKILVAYFCEGKKVKLPDVTSKKFVSIASVSRSVRLIFRSLLRTIITTLDGDTSVYICCVEIIFRTRAIECRHLHKKGNKIVSTIATIKRQFFFLLFAIRRSKKTNYMTEVHLSIFVHTLWELEPRMILQNTT